jgi:hypothetical protein
VFVPGRPFHLGLMFVSKAKDYHNEALGLVRKGC